jgi:hypothetical protein
VAATAILCFKSQNVLQQSHLGRVSRRGRRAADNQEAGQLHGPISRHQEFLEEPAGQLRIPRLQASSRGAGKARSVRRHPPRREKQNQPFQLSFNGSLKVDFQGSRVTSDGGLILVRELDERLGFSELTDQHLTDSRGRTPSCPSLTSLQQRLVKTGGRLIKHARYYWLLLAESHLTRRLFGSMLRRIAALPLPAG